MELGGVLLGAGMILDIAKEDYLDGDQRIEFMIEQIIETRRERQCNWVVLEGMQRPNAITGWRSRRIQVRVSALKRSLVVVA